MKVKRLRKLWFGDNLIEKAYEQMQHSSNHISLMSNMKKLAQFCVGTYLLMCVPFSATSQVANGCYAFRLASNGKLLTSVEGVLKVQQANGTDAQIFRVVNVTSNGVSILAPGARGGFLDAYNAPNSGNPIVLKINFPPVDINSSGTIPPMWYPMLINDGNPGNKYGFILTALNGAAPPSGSIGFGSTLNWGDGVSNQSVSDLYTVPQSDVNIFGSAKWYLESRTCPASYCDFNISLTVSNQSPVEGTNLNLITSCTGPGCPGVYYNFTPSSLGGYGNSMGLTARLYRPNPQNCSVLASKLGCPSKTSFTSFNTISSAEPNTNCNSITGNFDGYNCIGGIEGWLYDANIPNLSLTLDLYDGETLVQGNVAASNFRQDLLNAGIGNGYHGFNFPIPNSMKDGQNHSVTIRPSGCEKSYTLPGGPKTISCSPLLRISAEKDNSVLEDILGGLAIYPNPSSGDFETKFFLAKGKKASLNIINLYGQILQSKKIIGYGYHLEKMSGINASGILIVQLSREDGQEFSKLIVVR